MMGDKARFIHALAEYLAGPLSVDHSIGLAMPPSTGRRQHADLWQTLRMTGPIRGYLTVGEAETQLKEWFGVG
jgi:hypothetical protein